MTKFLILTWTGKWRPSDSHHGEVDTGPHESYIQAQTVLDAYIERQVSGWYTNHGQEAAERERKVLRACHHILPIEVPETPTNI